MAGHMWPADRVFETPRVNFSNILPASITPADPKSAKNTVKLSVFLPLWGYVSVKVTHKH